MSRRRENYIESQPESLLQHSWYDPTEQLAAKLQTGVSVDFDQPNLIITIYHEIQPKNFKVMLGIVGVQLQVGGLYGIKSDTLHTRIDHLTEVKFAFTICWIHIPLKLIVRDFVALLVFAVALTVLLDCIVRQMNHFIPNVFDIIVTRRSTDVTFTEPIGSHDAVESTYHHIVSDIELSSFI